MPDLSFDFVSFANTAAGVKRSYGTVDVLSLSLFRLYGNSWFDVLIPNVSSSSITWPLTGSDDCRAIGNIEYQGRMYIAPDLIITNETSNAWRITGTVRQIDPASST